MDYFKTEFDSTIVNSNVASRRGLLYAVSDPITAVNPIISAAGHYMAPGWANISVIDLYVASHSANILFIHQL